VVFGGSETRVIIGVGVYPPSKFSVRPPPHSDASAAFTSLHYAERYCCLPSLYSPLLYLTYLYATTTATANLRRRIAYNYSSRFHRFT
jgi:hypothetical protein